MDELFYNMIFKRKSFHIFPNELKLSSDEINKIYGFKSSIKVISDIKFDYNIVPSSETTCKRGEYCILLYSEIKDNYLQNIGYIGEQLDLYLASLNIGCCWYGIGKTNTNKYNDLNFVIMISIEKVDESLFRKDMFKSKRKELNEIWTGEYYKDIASIVRFTPSSCNTQPWVIESTSESLTVYRYKAPGKRGMMPINMVNYYNQIDIGILYLFIELCLKHNNENFKRELYIDNSGEQLFTLNAKYTITKKAGN